MGILEKIFGRQQSNILAEVEMIVKGENVHLNVSTPNNNNLIMLVIAYFTKIRWLIETDPDIAMERMIGYYSEALNNFPEIKNYTVFSPAAFGETQWFKIEASTGKKDTVGVINSWSETVGPLDRVDSCFVLLKEIYKKLDENEKELLVAALNKLQPLIQIDNMDSSLKGLENAYRLSGLICNLISGGYWEYLDNQ